MSSFQVKFNPFYERHDQVNVGSIRNELVNTLIHEVEDAFDANSPFIITLLGSVGVGKSFTLFELSEKMKDPLNYRTPKKVISVKFDATISSPTSKYIEFLFHNTMRKLSKDSLINLRKEFAVTYPERTEYETLLSEIHPSFKAAFLKLEDPENQTLITDWFQGESVNLKDLKKIGINTKIDSASNALRFFIEFSKILKLLDYSGVVLCIDEAEELALSGPSRLVNSLTQIKKVFEESKEYLSSNMDDVVPLIFCLSFTPGTYSLITGSDIAVRETGRTGMAGLSTFLRRIGREFVVDTLLDEDQKTLFKLFLNKARDEDLDIYDPFTEDAVNYIVSLADGLPGTLIEYSRHVLQKGLQENGVSIDRTFAQVCLIERGLIPEGGLISFEDDFEEVDI